ncbi:MAG: hypothetical protein IKK26_06650 [Clostridia bacterium]|nr:hypothetical protein [Clostridia bacterium]
MFGIFALLALFLFPVIVSITVKKYKLAIASAVCAIPCIISSVMYVMGYVLTVDVMITVKIVSVVLLTVCSVVATPFRISKVVVGIVSALAVLIILFDISTSASVDVVIDGKTHEASFSSFNVGPVVVTYQEKLNGVLCKREPVFYSALLSMGSEEDMKNAILNGEVGEYRNSLDDVTIEDFLK